MTDRCAPPDGSPSGWYWVLSPKGEPATTWWDGLEFFSGDWRPGSGWTYLRPCRPDDAEARERLEAEVATMRHEIARTSAIADHLMTENKRLREVAKQIVAADSGGPVAIFKAIEAARKALNAR